MFNFELENTCVNKRNAYQSFDFFFFHLFQCTILPQQKSSLRFRETGARTRLAMVAEKVYKRNEQRRKKFAAFLVGVLPSVVDAAGVSLKCLS